MIRTRSLALFSIALVFAFQSAFAQRDDSNFNFYARGPYRAAVPKPSDITRFDVGRFHTNYATMERVIDRIAQAAPDRVRITDIGETNEHRMMHVLVISSPENLARLDQIKAAMAKLADPRVTSLDEARKLAAEMPMVAWMNYTIHGNESSSFEAMLQVVYQLTASDEPATLDILKNVVVLVNTGANPDGHERFVTWYNSNAIGDPDPLAAEHREPWSVYGRLNHFRFDLNRDNIASTQRETRNVQKAYLEWNPQLFVDHHGQPSQFFFPPAALPINPNLPQDATSKWLNIFGKANAAQFDSHNWDFYVRDVYDLFYPGYWDSWPSLSGATGMTYETDGGGTKGYNWRRDDGTIVTLRSSIAKHFTASMTTLDTAAKNRAQRLADFYEFRRSGIEEGRTERMKRFVILPGKDPGKAAELVDVLTRAGIEVSVARSPFRSTTAHDFLDADSAAAPRQFPTGSYIVDLAQPEKRLAKALLEPRTDQDAAFVSEQLARFARNERRGGKSAKEDYGFYDITSWSLPLAYGVEAYWTEDAAGPRDTASIPDVNSAQVDAGVSGGRAAVAYIIPYDRDGAATLAYKLQRDGYRLSVATRTLSAGGRDWPRGTMVARVSRNPEGLHAAIARLATETGVAVTAVNSGFYETGETGIGSENVLAMKQPRIILVADEAVDATSYGAIWWTFDRMGIDFTPMSVDNIKRAELDKWNVIILPDGSASRYFNAFGKGGVDTLRSWMQRGGTLVCIRGAAVFAALKDVNLTSSRLVGSEDDDQKAQKPEEAPSPTPSPAGAQPQPSPTPKAAGPQPQRLGPENPQTNQDLPEKFAGAPPVLPPIASPSARPGQVPEGVPGAIMRGTVDRTTYLTFGYEDESIPVLVNSGYFFRPSKEGTNAVVFSTDARRGLRISGFVWPGNTERLLRGTSYVIDEPTGRGHAVLYAEEPNFRGIWRSVTRLFFNSLLFSGAM